MGLWHLILGYYGGAEPELAEATARRVSIEGTSLERVSVHGTTLKRSPIEGPNE